MPTYTYRRPDGTTFDVFQKISAPALTEDPETGVPVQRVISGGAGLQFKGDGFYITDYVRKGSDKGKTSDAGGSKATPKGESTSDAAPAKKADAKASSANGSSKGSSTDD